jgi:hypothetical protein
MAMIFGALFLLPWLMRWPRASWSVWSFGANCLVLLLYLWTASQASRFFVQARRNGLIELLVVGPLSTRQIVQGQWLGLVRTFALPVLLIVFLQVAASMLSAGLWSGMSTYVSQPDALLIAGFSATLSGCATVMNMMALAWFGMWMGLTSKSVNFATFKTLLFVQVIPWFAIMFGSLMLMPALAAISYTASGTTQYLGRLFPYVTALAAAGLTIGKDLGFVAWTRHRLYSSFRERASRNWDQPRSSALPPPHLPTSTQPPIPVPLSQ